MPNTFQCPSCSGTIEYTENNLNMACPFCGTAITTPAAEATPAAAATVVISKVESDPAVGAAQTMIQASRFSSTAEIMDEVKRLLREDDKNGAVKVYRKEFNLPLADARTAVDQIEIDMQHSGQEETPPPPAPVESTPPPPPPPAPIPSQPAISGDVVFDAAPPKKSSSKGWIIGCSIALVLFCCFCVILPTIYWVVTNHPTR